MHRRRRLRGLVVCGCVETPRRSNSAVAARPGDEAFCSAPLLTHQPSSRNTALNLQLPFSIRSCERDRRRHIGGEKEKEKDGLPPSALTGADDACSMRGPPALLLGLLALYPAGEGPVVALPIDPSPLFASSLEPPTPSVQTSQQAATSHSDSNPKSAEPQHTGDSHSGSNNGTSSSSNSSSNSNSSTVTGSDSSSNSSGNSSSRNSSSSDSIKSSSSNNSSSMSSSNSSSSNSSSMRSADSSSDSSTTSNSGMSMSPTSLVGGSGKVKSALRRSWARGLSPLISGGQVWGSVPGNHLRALRSGLRAGAIISATAVAFADDWKAGVNSSWYAMRGWGWRHPDNWKERTYKCVYGMDGRPCGPYGTFSTMWPSGVHCLPNECCSRVHISAYFARQVCSAEGSLCVIRYDGYSYGKCRCGSNTCGGDSVCVEEIAEHGGVYCRCKEGMIGNGEECYESLCKDEVCKPGKCVQEKTEVRCECPSNYEVSGLSCELIPMCNRNIEDICGPSERVLECVNIGRTDWTCVCAPGYAVVSTATGKQCEPASNTLFCSDKPCGTEGVKSCEDMAGGGVTCTCNTGYLLEKQDDGLRFKCSAIDPCKTQPCGSETVAKTCSRTAGGSYHCECQPSAELVEATGAAGPYCRKKEMETNVLPYVAVAAGGLALLGIGFGVWWFGFKSGSPGSIEYDYTADAFAGTASG
ncbi:hypothetical protein Efla_003733 [Eimeria flavescens]